MVHEHHDAPCFGQRVEWSRYGQHQFEMVIVRARTVQFNLKIAVLRVQGEPKPHICTHGQIRANSSATRATWFVWYTNSMMQLVLARGFERL